MLQLVLGDTDFLLAPGQAQLLLFDVVKILFVIAALLYLVFSFVVVRQIQVMRNTLLTPASTVIQIFGLIHLVFALGVVAWFVTWL